MKFITTGGEGQLGKELIKRLKSLGHTHIEDFDNKIGFPIMFMCCKNGKADMIIHMGNNCKIKKCIKYPLLSKENTDANYLVFEHARKKKIKKIVFFSSSRVLSKERNPYVASKIYGEELCKAYKECYGINYLIIRPSTVYGKPSSNKRAVDIWIDNAKRNKDLIIYGNKNKTLTFTYIDDFIDGVILAINNKWNKTYNVGGKEIKVIDMVKEIKKQTKSKSKIIFKNPELAQPQKVSVIPDGLEEIGWKPKININDGIRGYLNGKTD